MTGTSIPAKSRIVVHNKQTGDILTGRTVDEVRVNWGGPAYFAIERVSGFPAEGMTISLNEWDIVGEVGIGEEESETALGRYFSIINKLVQEKEKNCV